MAPRHRHHALLLHLLTCFLLSSADDSDVMLNLLSSLSPVPAGWSTTTPFCNWTNVACDSTSTFVTAVNLDSASVSGTLPATLNRLSRLQSLTLQRNSLSGPLPSFQNMSSLQTLYLSNNGFSSVPNNFLLGLPNLQNISISENFNLEPWLIPSYLAESTSLVSIYASNASLTGAIPDIFAALTNLQNLRLSHNDLNGALPKSLSASRIQNLWLNNQKPGLSGEIGVLSTMTELYVIWLHGNIFSGAIPDLSKCVNLFDLQLRDNKLTGVMPPSLMALPKLANVTLQNNKLQGPFPQFPSGVNATIGNTKNNSFCLDKPGPCDAQVTALLDVEAALGYPPSLAEVWVGNDACKSWKFVNCDSQGRNVTSVNMEKQGFSGSISPAFAKLTALKNLVLSDNNLRGVIPTVITVAALPQLQVFDVSNNNLSGPIPVFPQSVRFVYNGNALLDKNVSGSPNGRNSRIKLIAVGTLVSCMVFAVATVMVLLYLKEVRQRDPNHNQSGGGGNNDDELAQHDESGGGGNNDHELAQHDEPGGGGNNDHDHELACSSVVVYSIEQLRGATINFSPENIVGHGGFGVVYKGVLNDGIKVAVKKMETVDMKGLKEFEAEISVLTKVRHRHLVTLYGYCIEGEERLLVYEFMPQGNLSQHLFGIEPSMQPLTWKQRVIIALDVARGVEYLHSMSMVKESYIHRDLKPYNILLSDDMRAKVTDFGLVKIIHEKHSSDRTGLAGTFGYIAPEYVVSGKVTPMVDVYAFGVVLMEIITGRKAQDNTMPEEKRSLVPWFRSVLDNFDHLRESIDQTLNLDDETFESICKVAELAGHCTASEASLRPNMGHAISILRPFVEQWRPSSKHEEETNDGFDVSLGLPHYLEKWKAEGTSTSDAVEVEGTSSSAAFDVPKPSSPDSEIHEFSKGDGTGETKGDDI